MRPDNMDRMNAYRMGWRYGRDRGTSDGAPEEVQEVTTIPMTPEIISLVVLGAQGGKNNDIFRYLASYSVEKCSDG